MELEDVFLNINNTVLEALKALEYTGFHQTLFVTDDRDVLIGTLTDGDIRRYLISGGQLEDVAENAVHRNFVYIKKEDTQYLEKLKEIRASKIKVVPVLNKFGQIIRVFDLVNFKSHLPLDAVLMAGGKGERLRPLTLTIPKPLLKVGDKCIIDHNIDALIHYGINNISVTVNYLGELLENHYAEKRHQVQVKCIREPKFYGTIGSIRFIDSFVNDTVLVMNSDLFTNINFEDFYLHFLQNDADMSVAAVSYSVNVPYGILELTGRNITGMKEKPSYNYYVNAGIYLIKKQLLDLIPKNKFFNATDFIEMLIQNNRKVIRYPLIGYWIDIGKPEDYQKAQELVKHL